MYSRLLQDYRAMLVAVHDLLPAAAKAQLSEREFERVDLTMAEVVDVNEQGALVKMEYNDSCGCHPEMQSAYVTIAKDTLEPLLT